MRPVPGKAFRIKNTVAVQHVLHPCLVAAKLFLYGLAQTHDGACVKVVLPVDVDTLEQAGFERPYQLCGIHLVRLHCLVILGGRNVGGMYDDAGYAYFP